MWVFESQVLEEGGGGGGGHYSLKIWVGVGGLLKPLPYFRSNMWFFRIVSDQSLRSIQCTVYIQTIQILQIIMLTHCKRLNWSKEWDENSQHVKTIPSSRPTIPHIHVGYLRPKRLKENTGPLMLHIPNVQFQKISILPRRFFVLQPPSPQEIPL